MRRTSFGIHPSIAKRFVTTRVPGFNRDKAGSSARRFSGSRNNVSTVAWVRSAAYRSVSTNAARSSTPARSALCRHTATICASYSMPSARAPRWAAAITMRPSPHPASTTKSCDVTRARSSIASTSAGGVGTQGASLPRCPSVGSNARVGLLRARVAPAMADTAQSARKVWMRFSEVPRWSASEAVAYASALINAMFSPLQAYADALRRGAILCYGSRCSFSKMQEERA
jgi:hypothetical protein